MVLRLVFCSFLYQNSKMIHWFAILFDICHLIPSAHHLFLPFVMRFQFWNDSWINSFVVFLILLFNEKRHFVSNLIIIVLLAVIHWFKISFDICDSIPSAHHFFYHFPRGFSFWIFFFFVLLRPTKNVNHLYAKILKVMFGFASRYIEM